MYLRDWKGVSIGQKFEKSTIKLKPYGQIYGVSELMKTKYAKMFLRWY